MNKILIAVAAVATFGVAATANAADGRDQSLNTNAPVVVIEGRNAAVVATSSEAYIAQSVAQDARSTR